MLTSGRFSVRFGDDDDFGYESPAKLYQLLEEAAESHQPIQITGKRSNAILRPKRIGVGSRKLFICWPFQECANRFAKGWLFR